MDIHIRECLISNIKTEVSWIFTKKNLLGKWGYANVSDDAESNGIYVKMKFFVKFLSKFC